MRLTPPASSSGQHIRIRISVVLRVKEFEMFEEQVSYILAQLAMPSDKKMIANLRNFQALSIKGSPPATAARGETVLRLRHLGLLQKRPQHFDMPVGEAEHILTPLGIIVGGIISERFKELTRVFPDPKRQPRFSVERLAC